MKYVLCGIGGGELAYGPLAESMHFEIEVSEVYPSLFSIDPDGRKSQKNM